MFESIPHERTFRLGAHARERERKRDQGNQDSKKEGLIVPIKITKETSNYLLDFSPELREGENRRISRHTIATSFLDAF